MKRIQAAWLLTFGILALLMVAPASARTIDGTVTSTDPNSASVWVNDHGQTIRVVLQNDTRFSVPNYRADNISGLQAGDRIRIVGGFSPDGMFFADRVTLTATGYASVYNPPPVYSNYSTYNPGYAMGQSLYLTTPNPGLVVPPGFDVQGQTFPNALVQVTIQTPNRQWVVSNNSDASGHFDVPIQAFNEAPGAPMNLNVNAVDPVGRQAQPVQVQVIHQ